jgi:hypothetical protein
MGGLAGNSRRRPSKLANFGIHGLNVTILLIFYYIIIMEIGFETKSEKTTIS